MNASSSTVLKGSLLVLLAMFATKQAWGEAVQKRTAGKGKKAVIQSMLITSKDKKSLSHVVPYMDPSKIEEVTTTIKMKGGRKYEMRTSLTPGLRPIAVSAGSSYGKPLFDESDDEGDGPVYDCAPGDQANVSCQCYSDSTNPQEPSSECCDTATCDSNGNWESDCSCCG